jgi:hypothetical protein
VHTIPDALLEGVSIAGLIALAVVGPRAFYRRTYMRLVVAVVVLMIGAASVPLLFHSSLDPMIASTAVVLAALLYAIAQAAARLPARRQWIAESNRDPLVLTPPFEGRWRIVVSGPDPGRNHHLVASDQRFACDLIRAGAPSLGSEILAPVAGRVVSATDGQNDHRASLRVTEDTSPLGNHVAIDSGRGVVFLCHLQNGSVLVQTGDLVTNGTPIGRCGNSGRTSQPHLHIHAQDLAAYAFNRARGIPIAFTERSGAYVTGEQRTAT